MDLVEINRLRRFIKRPYVILSVLVVGLPLIYTIAVSILLTQPKNSDGINISQDLYELSSYNEYHHLETLIHRTLNKNSQALYELSQFDCKGGAGCYDLGYIITQIMFRMGEKDFIAMCDKLNNEQLQQVYALMGVGLEYGHGLDPRNFDTIFPLSSHYYQQRMGNKP